MRSAQGGRHTEPCRNRHVRLNPTAHHRKSQDLRSPWAQDDRLN